LSRWAKGADRVADLIEARHLQHVIADPDTEAALLTSARRHVESARQAAGQDPEAAYSLAYDAARKSATALLSHQGLRPTTAGGHIAVAETTRAQFPGVPGLTSLDRLRRRRNQAEYPDPRSYDPVTTEEANDAIQVATECIASTERLLQLDELAIFRP
jgi:HEPN domain-containing protein